VCISKMFLKIQLVILFVQILSVASRGSSGRRLKSTKHASHKNHQGDSSKEKPQEGGKNDGLKYATLNVKAQHAYGKNIKVSFNNPNFNDAGSYAFIGIFSNEEELPLNVVPDWGYFMAWLSDCYSQTCDDAVEKGSVTFSAKDPKSYYYSDYYEESYGYFPFRDGKYIACFINESYDSDDDGAESDYSLITNCKRFVVKKPPNKIRKKAKINPVKTKVKQKVAIKAKWQTPTPIQNQWVGLYAEVVENTPPRGNLSGKTLLWGYTGCPKQTGDQTETNNCSKLKKKGTITMNKSKLDKENVDAVWPLAKGFYYLCIQFHANEPYNLHKCSARIEIV